MSIKSDRWIRRMAREHRMIEPFTDKQVREGVISYGLSSYGYDVRIADEFKIFTNINSTIVDVKNFDPRSFVDLKADVCIIPPNSFALAQTVEYFRIPRNVLVICVGKSSYARCFRGDQRVALVDGTSVSLEDMARRADKGEDFWGYSLGEFGRVIVTKLEAPRFIGRDALLEIVLDSGEPIRCTPDHVLVRRDGTSAPAGELLPGDSLMPLYRQLVRGYEAVYQPLSGHLTPTHRLADEWNLRHRVYTQVEGEHAEWREKFNHAQGARARAFWTDPRYSDERERLRHLRRNPSDATREAHRAKMLCRYADPVERERQSRLMKRAWAADDGSRRDRQREIARRIRLRDEITADVVRRALDATGSVRGAARVPGCDRSVFRRFPELIHSFRGRGGRNHKIESIRELPGDHDVYCLTVPEAGNFALEVGVFVSNCGIIVNVTPLEPEWEGIVTLEVSNTTPLPAKIYANEGIAQVLFFESDEECETSYADKKGKYQAQKKLTLPRL